MLNAIQETAQPTFVLSRSFATPRRDDFLQAELS